MADPIRYVANDAVSRALAAADPSLARLIQRVGEVEFVPDPTRFATLARAIVAQQLSDASARAITDRVESMIGLTPESLEHVSVEAARGAGLSRRKTEYLRGLAGVVLSGDLDLEGLDSFDDAEVVERLTQVRGVGRWTADMFLLFALRRPDVIANGDRGIRSAAGRMMELGRPATAAELKEASERWRPHRSAATLYLYRDAVPIQGLPMRARA